MTILIAVGHELSHGLASLRDDAREDAVLLMMEVAEETTYVRHHKRKIALVLSAMRHFAEELRAAGWTVDYIRLDDPKNSGSFTGEVARAVACHRPRSIRIVEPGEWRVRTANPQLGTALRSSRRADDRRPLHLQHPRVSDLGANAQCSRDGVLLSRDAPQDRPADDHRRQATGWTLKLTRKTASRLSVG